MSTLRVTNVQDTAGANSLTTAQIYNGAAKAWVNFNGTGTVAIRASFNVSSITDNGVGSYTVNFATAFADANYSVQIPGSVVNEWARAGVSGQSNLLTTSVGVNVGAGNGAAADRDCVTVAIFR
jgi:hypothetical protein